MIRNLLPAAASFALVTGLPATTDAVAAQPASTQPVTEQALGACYDAQAQLVPFSGVVLARRGDRTFVRTAGFSDVNFSVPMARNVRFRLASVQKVLTRTLVGLLVQQGRIDLDRPIGTYLPNLPPEVAAITVDQLLQHRSGIAGMTRPSPADREAMMAARNARDLVPFIVSQPLEFRPGEREQYSNGGYNLIGAVIESVTGKDYGVYLQEALAAPLGMTSTNLEWDEAAAVRMTRRLPGGTIVDTPRSVVSPRNRPGQPAGDGFSTVDDLAKLGLALLGDDLLSPAVKARIFPRRGDQWRIGQAGGTIGTNTDFAALPESGWVVAVLSNYDPPTGELMGEVLRNLVAGKGCTPLRPEDRPSPFNQLPPRPAAPGNGTP